jgi:hypothetical protein
METIMGRSVTPLNSSRTMDSGRADVTTTRTGKCRMSVGTAPLPAPTFCQSPDFHSLSRACRPSRNQLRKSSRTPSQFSVSAIFLSNSARFQAKTAEVTFSSDILIIRRIHPKICSGDTAIAAFRGGDESRFPGLYRGAFGLNSEYPRLGREGPGSEVHKVPWGAGRFTLWTRISKHERNSLAS